jgi:hypothetical protein
MRSLLNIPMATFAGLLLAAPAVEAQDFSVIVHPSNPVNELSLSGLRAIFAGAVTHWPNQARIVLVHRSSGSAPNLFLMDRFLKTSWLDYKRTLEGLEFMGQVPVIVRVLNSDPAACKFVFNVPAAVSIVETASMNAAECREVRVVKIDGLLPAQRGYRLK